MIRCNVHRLLLMTLDLDEGDTEENETVEDTARAIAREIPEADWTVIDEWVER